MKHTFFLAASGMGSGLTSVSLGVFRALDRRGVRVGFCKPISQEAGAGTLLDPSSEFIARTTGFKPAQPIAFAEAERCVRQNQMEELMERVVETVRSRAADIDVMIVEGLLPTETQSFPNRINRAVVSALSAEVILVNSYDATKPSALQQSLELTASLYGGWRSPNVIGCILNKVHSVPDAAIPGGSVIGEPEEGANAAPEFNEAALAELQQKVVAACPIFRSGCFDLLGCIPWNPELPSFRVSDVAAHLGATIINAGEMEHRRVRSVYLCARNVPNILYLFHPGALLVAPYDRLEVFLTAALATMNGVPLAGIVVTGGEITNPHFLELCRPAFALGLPVLGVPTTSFVTATALSRINNEIPADDTERFNTTLDFIARRIDVAKLQSRINVELELRMSPAAFRHQLANRARLANKRIVLPEGEEPRTIVAASICQQRGLARCLLLGNPEEIARVARLQGVKLDGIEILDPVAVRERYVPALVEARKAKGLTADEARECLEDTVMLGTVMLHLNEVDGLVSGAVHSSANTIRPALQIIKTRPGAKVVSSVFFMCLPEQVLVYGDCAVNPDPDAESLADIAIQSADSAERFGIPARVAMISYSTGNSGSGAEVEKVKAAVVLAKQRQPGLLLDGPLQYDAAAIADVAALKAPGSPVAGRATVFVFPDLNTGNTTYKAVQRSANVVSIGPMLQGLRKPVNDLSRGALVEDIVYTIAITAVQATQTA
ncbi:MAG: phosphate acetyltransferase [Opitutaceae bacterium]|nr:phosphate acetyltransferase [Opitutaceae bacterium]